MNDKRTTSMKLAMARHFDENETDYREADWGQIVYEDSQVVLVEDSVGYEFGEWRDEFAGEDFSEIMHDLAGQLVDRQWPASYPVVFDKMES